MECKRAGAFENGFSDSVGTAFLYQPQVIPDLSAEEDHKYSVFVDFV